MVFEAMVTLLAAGLALMLWGPILAAWARGGRDAVRAFREELHRE